MYFSAFTLITLFASKQTFARIDYLQQGLRLVKRSSSFCVKFYAEKFTKSFIWIARA